MPLSKVSYPYPNDTLAIPKAAIASLFTEGFNSDSTIFTSTSSGNRISIQTDGNAARINFGSTVNPLAYGTVGAYSNLFNIQATGRSIVTTTDAPSLTTLITRGAVAQTSSLQEWQDSAGSVQSAVASDGTFSIKQIRNIGGSVNRAVFSDLSSSLIVNAANTNYIGLSVRRFNDSQTSDLQQWTNSTGGTVYTRIDKDGNIGIATVPLADLHIGGVGTISDFRMGNSVNNTVLNMYTASNDVVIHNATATGTLQLGTNSTERMRIDSSGTTTFYGDLVVNGSTTTVNSTTLTVDDKNIEMGAVVAGTVSTTGTVGSITGTGPWTATITNMTDTADLIVGSAITATNGTGSLGAGGTYIIASIVSGTSVTYTATGGTTPVAGTVTNITTTGATNTTANGGGIVLKGATDKSILWDSTNSNWTSTEHLNLATSKVFKINNTQVLSSTAVLGLTPTINATGYTLSGGTTAVAVTFAGGAAYTLSGTNGQTYTFPSATGTLITASSPTITTPTIDTINISGAAIAAALWNTTLTTGSISMGGALTTGGVNIATGTAFNGTVAIATGAGTVNKTINIGTGSTSGTTSIVIGSASGATSGITLNGTASISSTLTTGTVIINRSDASIEGAEIQFRRAVDNAVGFTVDVYGNNTSPDFRIFNSAGTQILSFSTAGLLTVPSGLTVTSGTLSINGASPTIASTNTAAASIFTTNVSGVTIGTSAIKTTEYPSNPSGTTSGTVTQSAQLNGYKGMPINQQGVAATALAYTLVAADAGKMIYVQSTPTTPTITIPANSAVAFEIGTTIVVMNDIGAATNVSINITTDTLQLVSTGATGTRTLARYGMATLVKVTATKWIITGNGVT